MALYKNREYRDKNLGVPAEYKKMECQSISQDKINVRVGEVQVMYCTAW